MKYIPSYERKSHDEGLQEGLQQGLQRLQTTLRETILSVLQARLGSTPPQIERGLSEVTDLDRLKSLVPLAATAATAEEFLQEL